MNYPNNEWKEFFDKEKAKSYFIEMIDYLEVEYSQKEIYPSKELVFSAFELTDFNEVKVVILGQDPYHGYEQANGLAFSTRAKKLPPSLKNIYKELKSDLNILKDDGDLSSWAKQGVLLLNTILTVEKNRPLSHKNIGWEIFTENIIKHISMNKSNIIFVLWGEKAKEKKDIIDSTKHMIIESSHPSPFSVNKGFFGSKPFSKINKELKKQIDW